MFAPACVAPPQSRQLPEPDARSAHRLTRALQLPPHRSALSIRGRVRGRAPVPSRCRSTRFDAAERPARWEAPTTRESRLKSLWRTRTLPGLATILFVRSSVGTHHMSDPSGIVTNRDLYCFIADLIEQHESTARSLEDYLRALYGELAKYRLRQELFAEDFATALGRAFEAPPATIERPLVNPLAKYGSQEVTFFHVAMVIDDQIDSLSEARRAELLDQDPFHMYTNGVSAAGRHWYNLHPLSYIECGVAGAFGGSQPEDEERTGRGLVPGLVMTPDGAKRPEDIAEAVRVVVTIGWNDVRRFLECGQNYE